jgi:general L-amino acid transport system permease protein
MGTLAAAPARPAPSRVRTALRQSIASPFQAILSIATLALAAAVLTPVVRWAVIDATWSGAAADCRAAPGGACWAFVAHKLSFLLFGLYPGPLRWRAALAVALLLALIALTAHPACWRRWLIAAWGGGLAIAWWLMHGGAGLVPVPTRAWGGLPVTLALTAIGLGLAFPVAVLLALARRSRQVVPRLAATAIVEVVRGVPLIAVLYIAALVLPLALPRGLAVDKLVLAQAGIAVFAAAYLAEAIRSGLQMVPRGQRDAALALGLTRWQAARLVVLPQALRIVIPSLVSIAVGFFQDTSLVVIIGIFDLLNTARSAAQDPAWLGFHLEAYAFVALIYFAGSASLSRYGLWLERRVRSAHGSASARPPEPRFASPRFTSPRFTSPRHTSPQYTPPENAIHGSASSS